jgi:hypothetical protein
VKLLEVKTNKHQSLLIKVSGLFMSSCFLYNLNLFHAIGTC